VIQFGKRIREKNTSSQRGSACLVTGGSQQRTPLRTLEPFAPIRGRMRHGRHSRAIRCRPANTCRNRGTNCSYTFQVSGSAAGISGRCFQGYPLRAPVKNLAKERGFPASTRHGGSRPRCLRWHGGISMQQQSQQCEVNSMHGTAGSTSGFPMGMTVHMPVTASENPPRVLVLE